MLRCGSGGGSGRFREIAGVGSGLVPGGFGAFPALVPEGFGELPALVLEGLRVVVLEEVPGSCGVGSGAVPALVPGVAEGFGVGCGTFRPVPEDCGVGSGLVLRGCGAVCSWFWAGSGRLWNVPTSSGRLWCRCRAGCARFRKVPVLVQEASGCCSVVPVLVSDGSKRLWCIASGLVPEGFGALPALVLEGSRVVVPEGSGKLWRRSRAVPVLVPEGSGMLRRGSGGGSGRFRVAGWFREVSVRYQRWLRVFRKVLV
eukprot:s901_g8.t1